MVDLQPTKRGTICAKEHPYSIQPIKGHNCGLIPIYQSPYWIVSLGVSFFLKCQLEFTHLNGVQLPSITILFIASETYIWLPFTQKRISVRIKPKLWDYYMQVLFLVIRIQSVCRKAILICFQLWQVFPIVAGVITFMVALESLKVRHPKTK